MAIAHLHAADLERSGEHNTTLPPTFALKAPGAHISAQYESSTQSLWSQWRTQGIPCFSLKLLHEMAALSEHIAQHFSEDATVPCRYLVVRSANPNVFNLGGDLGYFQKLILAADRAKLTEYAKAAVDVAYRNYVGHDIPGLTTVALLEGDALGGGFESALSCDVVVAEKHIKAGFPEVLFNMFPGMGGISFLSRRVGRTTVNELTSSGRMFTAQELLDLGVVDYVVDTGAGIDAVRQLMRQRERREEAHASLNVVDKLLRPVTQQELHEVVGIWVERALGLSSRGLEWMKRIHQQQLATFPAPVRPVALAA